MPLRLPLLACLVVFLIAIGVVVEPAGARAATKPHIFQHPALSKDLIAFGYAGDLWTVPRAGGVATRLTTGVGIETDPIFSPDGSMIAFTGDYDGNTDVFTIPARGRRAFSRDVSSGGGFCGGVDARMGRIIVFRSTRISQSRYTQLYEVPAKGGIAKPLPLPMAYQGQFSPDGKEIAYSPLPPAYGFDYMTYVSWGNYHGGRASTIWITTLPGLASDADSARDVVGFFAGVCGREGLLSVCAQGQGDDLQVRSGGEGCDAGARE